MAERVQRADRGEPGGILGLVRLIGEHRGAFEYDWRTRFGLPLTVVGKSMPWGEAVRLTRILSADPSAQVAAAVHDWETAVPREWLVLADIFDVLQGANWQRAGGKRNDQPKPYPRPFPDPNRRGRTNRTRAEVISILNAHGHNLPEVS